MSRRIPPRAAQIRERLSRTQVVNIENASCDVFIGRGSIWGNPFSHLHGTTAKIAVATREDAIEAYEGWLQEPEQESLRRKIPTLKGKTLGCFCKPLSCHGDILARLADAS